MRHSTTPHRGRVGVVQGAVQSAFQELPARVVVRAAANGRFPRVCFYAPQGSLVVVRSFAEGRGWRIGEWFTDDYPWSKCVARPGWGLVRQAVRSGRADGVVVPAWSVVSSSWGECAEQVAWFGERVAFIAVAGEGRR